MKRHILPLALLICSLAHAGEKIRLGETRPGTVRLGETRGGTVRLGENRAGTIRIGENRPGTLGLDGTPVDQSSATPDSSQRPRSAAGRNTPSQTALYGYPANERHTPLQHADLRRWRSQSGHRVEARLVGLGPATVMLRRTDGRTIRVARASLGKADRSYLWAHDQVFAAMRRAYRCQRHQDAIAVLANAIRRHPRCANIRDARQWQTAYEQALAFDREQQAKGLKKVQGLWVDPNEEAQTDWELVLDKGLRRSPPDEGAARQVVGQLANEKVSAMLHTRRLLAAATVETVLEYRDSTERDAVASVYYDFVERNTRAEESNRKQGFLRFYHDPALPAWIHSDTKVGRLP